MRGVNHLVDSGNVKDDFIGFLWAIGALVAVLIGLGLLLAVLRVALWGFGL